MPVNVGWFDVDHTIIKFTFYGKWTWDEMYQAFDVSLHLSNSVDHDVYALAMHGDEAAFQHVPPNVIAHFPNLARRIPSNVRVQVIVLGGLASFWRTIYQSIRAIYPGFTQYMTIANTEEEALRIIQDMKANDALARGS
jgi:hypothetical protein